MGNPEQVAAAGASTFILSGYPHLEEAYRFAELVMPLFGPSAVQRVAPNTGPFGETIANSVRQRAAAEG